MSLRRRGVLAAVCALTVAATLASGATALAAPPTAPPAADRQGLQAALDRTVAAGGVGAVLQIRDELGTSSLASGTERLGGERRVREDSRFRAGSITKTLVATVVLQLVAEGRVELDAPVERYLPGLLAGHPYQDRITVRQVLRHTSGLDDALRYRSIFGQEWVATRFERVDAEELVRTAATAPPLFEPDTSWAYSNTNYVLAGLLVEEVTGRPYAQEVERRILRPLDMRDTYLPGTAVGIRGRHAHAYMRLPGREQPVDITRQSITWAGAAGELVSTTEDLNRFYTALLGGRLLPEAQLAEMKRGVEVGPGYHYGLGLYSVDLGCGVTAWGHDGGVQGYVSVSWHTEDGSRHVTANVAAIAPDHAVAEAATSGALVETVVSGLCGVPQGSVESARTLTAPTVPVRLLGQLSADRSTATR